MMSLHYNQDLNIKGNSPGYRTKSFANNNIKKMFEKYIGKKIFIGQMNTMVLINTLLKK